MSLAVQLIRKLAVRVEFPARGAKRASVASVISKAVRIYKRRGVAGIAAAARTKLGREKDFQEKAGIDERLAQLDRAVPADTSSLVDIGCNLGMITAHFAERGAFSIGIDIGQRLIERANARHAAVANCGFMTMNLTPDNIATLPVFDTMLLLSVHHNWVQLYGPDDAGEMLRALSAKAGKTLIFEGPSRRGRYANHPPEFVDNDEASVTAYHEGYLQKYLGSEFSRIEPLGKTTCWGEGDREPYRWSWARYR